MEGLGRDSALHADPLRRGGVPRAEGGEVDSCRGGGDVRVVLKTLVVENQRARGVTGDEGALFATAEGARPVRAVFQLWLKILATDGTLAVLVELARVRRDGDRGQGLGCGGLTAAEGAEALAVSHGGASWGLRRAQFGGGADEAGGVGRGPIHFFREQVS